MDRNTVNNKLKNLNALFPIGTEVDFFRTLHDEVPIRTKTASEVFLLSGHTECVFLDKIRGCVSINHVKKVDKDEQKH